MKKFRVGWSILDLGAARYTYLYGKLWVKVAHKGKYFCQISTGWKEYLPLRIRIYSYEKDICLRANYDCSAGDDWLHTAYLSNVSIGHKKKDQYPY